MPRSGHQGRLERRRTRPRTVRAGPRRSGDQLGLSPTIAYVNGDNLLARCPICAPSASTSTHFETGEPAGDLSRFITANAYLGCFGIVEALTLGADIVVTGRVTDAAVVCGPAAWHHGWAPRRLGRACGRGRGRTRHRVRRAGHRRELLVLHARSPTWSAWASRGPRSPRTVRGHRQARRTGGEVSVGTVTSQLLYEIGAPRTSALMSRRDSTRSSSNSRRGPRAHQRHRGRAATHHPQGRHERGRWISAKTSTSLSRAWTSRRRPACRGGVLDRLPLRARRVRERDHPGRAHRQGRPADQRRGGRPLAGQLKDPDERKVGAPRQRGDRDRPRLHVRGSSSWARPLRAAWPSASSARRWCRPIWCPSTWSSLAATRRSSTRSLRGRDQRRRRNRSAVERPRRDPRRPCPSDISLVPGRATRGATPIRDLRSQRRGVGLARRFLQRRRVAACLPEPQALRIRPIPSPPLRSLNFVLHGLLDEGVAASTRQDAQAKGLGEWLRSRVVDVPTVPAHVVVSSRRVTTAWPRSRGRDLREEQRSLET